VSLILIAGAIVLQFFVVLSGVRNTTPLNKTYFLQADTSSIAGSGRAISQWTYFYVCGAGNQDCGKPVPDLPFGYAWVGGSAGAPAPLIGSVSLMNHSQDGNADKFAVTTARTQRAHTITTCGVLAGFSTCLGSSSRSAPFSLRYLRHAAVSHLDSRALLSALPSFGLLSQPPS
jgi:hypothetical protein